MTDFKNFSGSSNTSTDGTTYFGILDDTVTFTVSSGHTVYFWGDESGDNEEDNYVRNEGTIINNGTINTHKSGDTSNVLLYFRNQHIIRNNGNIDLKSSHNLALYNSTLSCIQNYKDAEGTTDTPQIINNGFIGTWTGSNWINSAGIINSKKKSDNTWLNGNYISNVISPILYNDDGTLTMVTKGTTLSTNGGCAIMPASNTSGSEYEITGDDGASGFCDTFTLQGNFSLGEMRMSLNVVSEITYIDLEGFIIPSGITLTCGATNSKLTIGSASSSFIYENNGTVDTGTATPVSTYYSFSSTATSISSADEGTIICFYGFVNVMTKDGLKQIKDLVLSN